jgi:hypothetical protein
MTGGGCGGADHVLFRRWWCARQAELLQEEDGQNSEELERRATRSNLDEDSSTVQNLGGVFGGWGGAYLGVV